MLYFYSIFLWFKYAIKTRSFVFFLYSNPAIFQGGMFNERKTDIYTLLPQSFLPKTILVNGEFDIEKILKLLEQKNISFPIFLKPNIGFRGFLAQRIDSEFQLQSYISKFKTKEFLLQEFIDFENEYAVLYYRFPHNKETGVSSFSSREYPHIIGDNESTVSDLIKKLNNTRIDKTYLNHINIDKKYIPTNSEKVILDYVGNFARGSSIISQNNEIDSELIKCFDEVIGSIEGLNFVRVDLKANSIQDIKNKNFIILEVNGAKSEPLHRYDSKFNFKERISILKNHWKLFAEISVAHRHHKPHNYSVQKSIKSLIQLYAELYFKK